MLIEPVKKFTYVEVKNCICGMPLESSGAQIQKNTGRGNITFKKCKSCGSYIQAPKLSSWSLTEWYNSDEYYGSNQKSGAGYHDYFADEENRLIEAHGRAARDIKPLLKKEKSRILEIGCATGSLLKVLQDDGHDVTGIDLSQEFVEFGVKYNNLNLKCADIMELDLEPESFDLIILLGTISNLSEAELSLAKIIEKSCSWRVYICELSVFRFFCNETLWRKILDVYTKHLSIYESQRRLSIAG